MHTCRWPCLPTGSPCRPHTPGPQVCPPAGRTHPHSRQDRRRMPTACAPLLLQETCNTISSNSMGCFCQLLPRGHAPAWLAHCPRSHLPSAAADAAACASKNTSSKRVFIKTTTDLDPWLRRAQGFTSCRRVWISRCEYAMRAACAWQHLIQASKTTVLLNGVVSSCGGGLSARPQYGPPVAGSSGGCLWQNWVFHDCIIRTYCLMRRSDGL
jgi:hypothetical protein